MSTTRVDVLIIGGGPAGSTAGCLLARAGLSVLLCEREKFPRFHVGESLLPYTGGLWRRLGVYGQLLEAGFQRKWGARFKFEPGNDVTLLDFQHNLDKGSRMAFQVRRADYDQLLLKNAAADGVKVLEETEVVELRRQGEARIEGAVAKTATGEKLEIEAGFTIDATGRDTFLGSRLGIKQRDKVLRQVALFRHFKNAKMGLGRDGGDILVVGGPYGWFWMIPLDKETTSVGIVCPSQKMAERGDRGLEQFYASLIAESPEVSMRLKEAEALSPLEVAADFSYRCSRLHGENWALAGDAACFLDPVFSSGVLLAMKSAERLADTIAPALKAGKEPKKEDLEAYQKFVRRGLDRFRRYIVGFYEPGCASVFRRRPPHILKGACFSAFGGKIFERDLRIGAFNLAFFSRAAMNRKAARKKSGELPPAPACDVKEPELLREGLPFGKFG
jgi:flavin-dependent dehydrogenase